MLHDYGVVILTAKQQDHCLKLTAQPFCCKSRFISLTKDDQQRNESSFVDPARKNKIYVTLYSLAPSDLDAFDSHADRS